LDKSAELHKRLKLRRERLQSRSKQRTQDWIDGVDTEDAKNIVQGAMRQSMSPKLRVGMELGQQIEGLSIEDQRVEKGALTLATQSPEKSYYNGIYLRNYEPEFVKREKDQGQNEYARTHLR
jgi:hypothetical protein